ncbi:N-acetylmuramoyl-L-alanine amidase family protein [Bacillus sp. OTU530]|uniref:N-acetylmuramoyl-L-alanine amidase family protein n=1 Tax=Bacillus sp. OTU530 TaxID=3043862 RepID=UPI00313EF1EC
MVSIVKIYIDAGHGGQDSGAVGNGLQEKNIVLEIARQMNQILVKEYENVQTAMTRMDDTFVSLSDRASRANAWGADAFISIHCNSGGGKGFESYRYSGASDSRTIAFQNTVHDHVMGFYSQHGIVDRGKKSANYAVLRETNMIAVLTENLFMDNVEITKFNDLNFLIGAARAHAEGVAAFFGLKKKTTQPQIVYIYTGGYAGNALVEVHDYLLRTGDGFDCKRGEDGSIIFLIGPFDTSQQNFKDCKNFLDSKGHYNKLLSPEEAADWR